MSRTIIDDIEEIKREVVGKKLWANYRMVEIGDQLYDLSPEEIKELWFYFLILSRKEWYDKYNSSEETKNV